VLIKLGELSGKLRIFTVSTPISSQANPEGLEGSETRAYDPGRVMELHECLGRISILWENSL
jgi:hypothetical protein